MNTYYTRNYKKKWRDKYLKPAEAKAKAIIVRLPAPIPLLLKKSIFSFRYWRAELKDKKKKNEFESYVDVTDPIKEIKFFNPIT
jgi:hypothetical protein